MKPLVAHERTQAHRISTGGNDINFFNRSSAHLLWLPLYLTVKYLISSRGIDTLEKKRDDKSEGTRKWRLILIR